MLLPRTCAHGFYCALTRHRLFWAAQLPPEDRTPVACSPFGQMVPYCDLFLIATSLSSHTPDITIPGCCSRIQEMLQCYVFM